MLRHVSRSSTAHTVCPDDHTFFFFKQRQGNSSVGFASKGGKTVALGFFFSYRCQKESLPSFFFSCGGFLSASERPANPTVDYLTDATFAGGLPTLPGHNTKRSVSLFYRGDGNVRPPPLQSQVMIYPVHMARLKCPRHRALAIGRQRTMPEGRAHPPQTVRCRQDAHVPAKDRHGPHIEAPKRLHVERF